MSKPENSTVILDANQKTTLANSLTELGMRRSKVLEGLDFTLGQLEEEEDFI